MYDLILIPHKEVTRKQLEDIIEIKSKAWPYSFSSQLEWINVNLKANDIHVLLTLDKTNVAYLNLIEIKFKLDGVENDGFGIGNVCASEKGKGWGKEIMAQTNLILNKRKKIGLLFCKKSLVTFYNLSNWRLIEHKKLKLSFNSESIETMIFNCKFEFQHLDYMGKPF
jgi:hypothetical protein